MNRGTDGPVANRRADTRGATSPATLGIVVAVRNEAATLPELFESIRSQSALDSLREIAIVDGLSEDTSLEVARAWQRKLPCLTILSNPRRIAPTAFNIGARHCLSRGVDAVLIVGAHSSLGPEFLEATGRALKEEDAAIIGSVHEYPAPRSAIESAIQAFTESQVGCRMSRFSRMTRRSVTDVANIPTIRREVFDAVGFFDERLVRNQDNEFTTRARRAGFKIMTDPALRYRYYTRETFSGIFKQMEGNGYWVGMRPRVHAARHFAPFIFWASLVPVLVLCRLLGLSLLAGFAVWALPYLLATFAAAASWAPRIGRAALFLPWLFWGGHARYAWGTLKGLAATLSRGKRTTG